MTTAVVVATRRWTERACDELTRQFDVRLNQEDHPLSLDEVRLRCEGGPLYCARGVVTAWMQNLLLASSIA